MILVPIVSLKKKHQKDFGSPFVNPLWPRKIPQNKHEIPPKNAWWSLKIRSTQDSAKQSKPDENIEALEDKEQSVKCDICNFKARGEWTMIKHMNN